MDLCISAVMQTVETPRVLPSDAQPAIRSFQKRIHNNEGYLLFEDYELWLQDGPREQGPRNMRTTGSGGQPRYGP
jgi:hypothetical protein